MRKGILIGFAFLLAPFIGIGIAAAGPGDTSSSNVAVAASYAGSESCQECHSGHFDGWAGSKHPYMITPAWEERPDGSGLWIWDASVEALKADMEKDKRDFAVIGGIKEPLESLDQIIYTSGNHWKQRFVVRTGDGHRFLTAQYYPDGAKGPGLYSYGGGSIYEDRCLACHSTGFDYELSKTIDRTADGYSLQSVAVELGVGCEACHGPGSKHVDDPTLDNIWNPAHFTVAQQNDLCGTCHARNTGSVGYSGRQDAINFVMGDDLREYTHPTSLARNENAWVKTENGEVVGYFDKAEGGSQRWLADGSARSHRMQYNEMEMNRMKWKMGCTACHDPHDPSSLVGGSWASLLQHEQGRNTCINCHEADWDLDEAMPKTAMSQNTPDIRRHTFGRVNVHADIPSTTDSN